MAKIDPKEIVKLLAEGKKDKAKLMLLEFLKSVELSEKDKGAVYAQMAEVFLSAQNDIAAKYESFLEKTAQDLKPLEKLKHE